MMQLARTLGLALLLLATLAPAARAGGITTAQEQQRAREEVNRYRSMVGMPAVSSTSGLDTAALGHSRYVLHTAEYGHYENQTSSPYYIGYAPGDRARKYGYTNDSVTENYYMGSLGARGTRTPLVTDNAMQWWMAAIYHRFPIVSPRTEHIGFGPYYLNGRAAQVLKFGGDYSNTGRVTRWPVTGQVGVGTRLDGESPSPVAQFGGSFPTGYPVSMTWYRYNADLRYTQMSLVRARDGLNIDGYKLTPTNDTTKLSYYSTSLTFIPSAPLAYGTRYAATFKGSIDGVAFSYVWSFTTMPAPGRLVASTPASGATGTPRVPNVSLSFNQPVRTYTLVRSPYRGGLDSNGVGVSLARASDGAEVGISISQPTTRTTKTVTFKPSVMLAANTRYVARFTLADAWGRPYRGTVYFTTGS